MNNDLSTGHYVSIALCTIIIIAIVIFTVFSIIESQTSIKNYKITYENYNSIYDIVNKSSEITLQEKANFNKNYTLFGKKIIGYKVKDVIKEIEI